MTARTVQRRRSGSRGPVIAKGLVTLVLMAALLALGLQARNGIPGVPHYMLQVQFGDLSNLVPTADVRIGGVRVGQVLNPRLEGDTAVADLQLDTSVDPLPSDTTFRIRSRSLLGERYVDVSPGTSQAALAPGATVRASQSAASPELTDVLQTFDSRRRDELQTVVRSLGNGFVARGADLNAAVAGAPRFLADMTKLSRAVNAHPAAVRRLVPAVESAVAPLALSRDDIAAGLAPEAAALQPFADHRSDVERLLTEAPDDLSGIRTNLASTSPLLAEAGRLARGLDSVTSSAPASLRRTRQLLDRAGRPLRTARPVVDKVDEAAPTVLRLAKALDPALPQANASLDNSRPLLHRIDVSRCDIAAWGRNWRRILAYGTQGGGGPVGPLNVLRLEPLVSNPVGGVTSGGPGYHFGDNPIPRPCEALTDKLR